MVRHGCMMSCVLPEHTERLLLDPAFSFRSIPDLPSTEDVAIPTASELVHQAHEFYGAMKWFELGTVYDRFAERAWRSKHHAFGLRMLLAAKCAFERAGNWSRARESTAYLAQRHRLLREGSVAAEAWNHWLLSSELDASTATVHAAALREIAAIREVTGHYQLGLDCCDRSMRICDDFRDVEGIDGVRIKTLIQRSVINRLRGRNDIALEDLRLARTLAARSSDANLLGVIALRAGGLNIVIGRPEDALLEFRRAENYFRATSPHNLAFARIRQVSCLRALGRHQEAADLTEELLAGVNRYQHGQVLIERAEVLEDLGRRDEAADVLAAASEYYADSMSLEALRWRYQVARNLLRTGRDSEQAVAHLCTVLRSAARPDRRDLTRTMLALYEVLRLPEAVTPPFEVALAAGNAALLAADLQRTSLDETADRWAMHRQREQIYGAVIRLHHDAGDADSVVRIIEIGRADLLNQLLSTGTDIPSAITDSPLATSAAPLRRLDEVFDTAKAVADYLHDRTASPPPVPSLPDSPPPMRAPADGSRRTLTVITQIGREDNGDWWSVVGVQGSGPWRTCHQRATERIRSHIDDLVEGRPLPPRGVTLATWNALTDFLLPDDEIWSGSTDQPISLILGPDPRLWQLPYPALVRSGVRLLDTATVALIPSLRTVELLRERNRDFRPDQGPAASVLDTTLPGGEIELAALDEWPLDHHRMNDLTPLAVIGNTSILYVNGTGRAAGADAQPNSDITLEALAGASLPPLVVLNGCWSGTPMSRFGQDPLSLAVGALLGGASTVIAGIGLIGGIASAHIAAGLLRRLADRQPIQLALRDAQRAMRAEHPELGVFDWAGLCAVGLEE
ncbi:CHAT domain-containing protein [Nocardia gamkensis]|uniref:CHAT domain-containing protein n=1 Tax=Nocardia gamkensis TaxID=352869 RepID=UPI0033E1FB26